MNQIYYVELFIDVFWVGRDLIEQFLTEGLRGKSELTVVVKLVLLKPPPHG